MQADNETTHGQVLDALRTVIDPELGMNVVDLGLVYRVDVDGSTVHVAMTMTSPTCPLGESMAAQAEAAIRRAMPDLASVRVDLVWEPPWDPSHMSASAKERLGWT